jgi:Chemotaxis signal transduction protein
MQSEHAGGQEEKFLAFSAGGISYVLPLSDVGQIVAEVPQNMPEISVSGTKGGCAVIFQDDAGFAALSVEKVSGIVELKPSCQHEMPEEVRTLDNRWLAGIAYVEKSGELCYLVDCRQLRARFIQERG